MSSDTSAPDTGESLLEEFEPESPRRRGRLIIVLTVVLVVLAGAYAAAAWWLSERIPRETSIAGVDVGFLTADEARDVLAGVFDDIVATPITVELGDNSTTLVPADVSLELDVESTIDELTGFTLHPRIFVDHITGKGEYTPVVHVDADALTDQLAELAEVLDTAPREGAITLSEGEAEITDPIIGLALDEPAARELIEASWISGPRPLELPGVDVPPVIGAEAVEEAMRTIVRPLTGAPISVSTDEGLVELSVADLTSIAVIEPDGSSLVLVLDTEGLVELVRERNPELEDTGTDARIIFDDGAPAIIPSEPGLALDEDALVASVSEAMLSSTDRTAVVELVEMDPEFTTADAEALGVVEEISKFQTPFPNDPPRTSNLQVAGQRLTGTLIKPGETFSLIEALGPITAEAGFQPAGVVVDGFETQGMGGGLSQVSTTVFNAAYFAGMDLVEFQPHSRHFSRYPEGRESTIYTPSIDLKWTNTTPYGALVQAWVAGGEFHVRIWGTEHFDVESYTTDRYNFTQPRTLYNTGANCVPNSNPQSGFTVQNTRTISLDGEEVDRQTWTTTYSPWHRVVCGSEQSASGSGSDDSGDDSDDG